MEFSFTPYDLYQPTPDPFVNGPHEIYGWPQIPNNLWMAPTSKKLHFGLYHSGMYQHTMLLHETTQNL